MALVAMKAFRHHTLPSFFHSHWYTFCKLPAIELYIALFALVLLYLLLFYHNKEEELCSLLKNKTLGEARKDQELAQTVIMVQQP